MEQCWISSVGSPLGFSESDMFCPSLVSPGAVCRLNNKYELNRLKYWKQNRTTWVSFTMKCSIRCLSTLTGCSSHPAVVLIAWSDLLHHPASRAKDLETAWQVESQPWKELVTQVFSYPHLTQMARVLSRSTSNTPTSDKIVSVLLGGAQRKGYLPEDVLPDSGCHSL